MKTYVWDGVMPDHTCGMIVVIAHNDQEGASLLVADDMVCQHVDVSEDEPDKQKGDGLFVDGMRPYVYGPNSTPYIRRVYGGG